MNIHFLKLKWAIAVISIWAIQLSAQDFPHFAVLSDTHIGRKTASEEKTSQALKNLLGKSPQVDAVFVVGDLTDKGFPEQYDRLLSVFSDKRNVPEGVPVYLMGGFNHDSQQSMKDTTKTDYEMYREKINKPLNQYIEIKGYPFIAISEGGSNHASAVNAAALKFLEEKMEYAVQKFPGKPVFVFMHEPPNKTCYGSYWGTDHFLPVLNRYPQAIVFAGHSHSSIGDPRSIHQGVFTAVNDGGTAYLENEPCGLNIGTCPEHSEEVTEGLLVNILPNGDVEMERWDTYRNEEILPKWLVKAPHDGNHFTYKDKNGLPAPFFAKKAKLKIKQDGNSVEVVFPQATDNEIVEFYIVEITADGQTVVSFRKSSQYYLNSEMPAELTVAFSGLPAGKKLTAQVTAVDSYKHQSVAIKSDKFLIQQ